MNYDVTYFMSVYYTIFLLIFFDIYSFYSICYISFYNTSYNHLGLLYFYFYILLSIGKFIMLNFTIFMRSQIFKFLVKFENLFVMYCLQDAHFFILKELKGVNLHS
jgi:hypothetical protein